jgi:hypothetical protein
VDIRTLYGEVDRSCTWEDFIFKNPSWTNFENNNNMKQPGSNLNKLGDQRFSGQNS